MKKILPPLLLALALGLFFYRFDGTIQPAAGPTSQAERESPAEQDPRLAASTLPAPTKHDHAHPECDSESACKSSDEGEAGLGALGEAGAAAPEPEKTRGMRPPANVRTEDVEAYLKRAGDNPESQGLMLKWLDRQRDENAIQFMRTVTCRGFVCKSVLTFSTIEEAKKLINLETSPDSEYVSTTQIQAGDDTSVTLYTTLPGTSFQEAFERNDRDTGTARAKATELASALP